MAAASAVAIKMSADFETAMTKTVTLAGETSASMEEMRQAVLALAPTVGIGPVALAEALVAIESTGFTGAKALEILTASAQASAIGMGDAKDVGKAITAVLNAYGDSNITAAEAADQLHQTVLLGGADADTLAGELGRVVGVASQLGVSFSEVGAFIATYTKLGLSAAEATTGLSGVLNTILSPSREARDALAGIGMSADMLRQQVAEQGLGQTLIGLIEKLNGNADATAAVFGNVRALAGVMGTAATQANMYAEAQQKIANSSGGLVAAFNVWQGTTAATWAKFSAGAQAAAIAIGDKLAPAFSRMLTAAMPIADTVVQLVNSFSKLPQPVQTTALALLGLAAAAGPLAKVVAYLMQAGSALLALLRMTGVTAFIGTLVKGIGELGAMTSAFGWEGFLVTIRGWGAAFQVITGPVGAVIGIVTGLIVAIKELTGSWTAAFAVVLPPIGAMMLSWQQLKGELSDSEAFETIWGIIKDIASIIKDSFLIALQYAQSAWNAFADTVSEWAGVARDVVGGAVAWIGDKLSFLKGPIQWLEDKIKWLLDKLPRLPTLSDIKNTTAAMADAVAGEQGRGLPNAPGRSLAQPMALNATAGGLSIDQAMKMLDSGPAAPAIKEFTQRTNEASESLKKFNERTMEFDIDKGVGDKLKGVFDDGISGFSDILGDFVDPKQWQEFMSGGATPTRFQPDWMKMVGFESKIPQFDPFMAMAPNGISSVFSEAAPGIGTAFRGMFQDLAKNFGPTIMQALTGGGSVSKAIGGLFGSGLGDIASKTFAKPLGDIFGKTFGGILGSLIPGLGTLFGSLLGNVMGSVFNKIFKSESKQVNRTREEFVQSQGGLSALNEQAAAAGMTLDKFLKVSKVEDFNAALKELTDAIDTQKLRNDFIAAQGGLETLGYTAQRAGIDLKAALDAKTPEAFNLALDEINKKLEEQQKRVEGLKTAGQGLADRLAIEGAGGNPAALAPIAQAVFGGVLAETGSMTQAMAAIAPALDLLLQKQQQIPAAAMESVRWLLEQRRIIVENGPVIAAIEADTAMLRGLGEAGRLTFETFSLLTQDVIAQWDALAKKGVAQDQALAAMQPALQAIWEAQTRFGFAVDASTQKLIDMGLAANMIGPQFQDPAHQMVDALMTVNQTLTDILVQLGGVPSAAAAAGQGIADGLSNINVPPVIVPIVAGSGGGSGHNEKTTIQAAASAAIASGGSTMRIRAMASGGIVRRPTMAMIGEDGPEAVVPLDRGGVGGTVNVYVNGSADADFAEKLARQISRGGSLKTQWRGALR